MLALLVATLRGCGSTDERLVRATQEADARQAEQHRELAQVVTDQQNIQKGIETQHQHLDDERSALDSERRALAAERVRDPIIANALIGAVVLAACALPSVLAFVVLRGAHQAEPDGAALTELLVQELVAEEPLLLPRPTVRAIEKQPPQVETALRAPGGS
jgi:hypothetical protein